ncbi:MAG: putative sulfate exporter family transporter [Holophagales bacterium]|nr:MAG: putative sulfate exporter family transporter [Holophagales bacterium]
MIASPSGLRGHAAAIVGLGSLCLLPDLPAIGWRAVPSWLALLAGVAVALAFGNPWAARTRAATGRLLAASVVGLGAAMNLRTVARVGLQGFVYTLAGIAGTLLVAAVLGRLLALRPRLAVLLGVGTAICGGSAIAAAAPVVGADDDETSTALGIVFLLNASALLLFPLVGERLGLSPHAFGLWAALAIHDTSSVVGAASAYGGDALLVATTVKLARALWIVPVTLALGASGALRRRTGQRPAAPGKARRPWFVLGFLAAAAVVTFVPALQPAGHLVAEAARRSLVLTLFLLGLGMSREALARVGARPFVMAVVLWATVASVTLGAIRAGWIG